MCRPTFEFGVSWALGQIEQRRAQVSTGDLSSEPGLSCVKAGEEPGGPQASCGPGTPGAPAEAVMLILPTPQTLRVHLG